MISRVNLARTINLAHKLGIPCAYVDTDSLFLDVEHGFTGEDRATLDDLYQRGEFAEFKEKFMTSNKLIKLLCEQKEETIKNIIH